MALVTKTRKINIRQTSSNPYSHVTNSALSKLRDIETDLNEIKAELVCFSFLNDNNIN